MAEPSDRVDPVPPAPRVPLSDGHAMPAVALGTFQGNYSYTSVYEMVKSAVCSAIDIGFRHFDTAYIYDTEKPLGEALKKKMEEGVVKREDLYITTKLWGTFHRQALVPEGCRKSLQNLGLDYVDMLLVHWPVSLPPSDVIWPKDDEGKILLDDDQTDLIQCWKGMEECVRLGLTRSIGVSNFNQRQLQLILDNCTIKPANNQVESNPFFANGSMVEFCKKNGILVSCFSPLGKPHRTWDTDGFPYIYTDPTITRLADKYRKSHAQIACRFQIQRGLVVTPKSSTPKHQAELLNIFDFELSPEDMEAMYSCDKNFRVLTLKHLLGESKEYPYKDDE